MKHFKLSDVRNNRVVCEKATASKLPDLLWCSLEWQRRGLQKTASGYGAKIPTRLMIIFENRLRRIYTTCYGNAASDWFIYKGKKIFVD